LIQKLEAQIKPFNPDVYLNVSAVQLVREEASWILDIAPHALSARAILLCTGAGAFTPKRPAIPNIQDFEENSVLYRVDDPKAFRGKRVMIAGGGDSAVDWSLLLCNEGAEVCLVHRRDTFRAQEASLSLLQAHLRSGKIRLFAPCQVSGLDGSNGQLSRIQLQTGGQELSWVQCDVLLPCFGLETQKSPFESWGITLKSGMIMTNPVTGETSVPGIYAAGDCVSYPEKLKLIMTGFSEVSQAAHHIRKHCFAERVYKFEHSTSLGVPS
jgi:thioredoxin reductase (NADPH)